MTSAKDVAWRYFALIGEGRIDEAVDLLHDDGTLWSSGPRKTIPMRTHKATVADILRVMPMKFILLDAVEQGDKVVLEIESHATLRDGTAYNNVYAFIMTILDGKIFHIREHADTHHTMQKLPPEAWAVEKDRFVKHHAGYHPA